MIWLPGIIVIVFILLVIYAAWAERYYNKRMKKTAETDPAAANKLATMNCTASVRRCKCGRIIR